MDEQHFTGTNCYVLHVESPPLGGEDKLPSLRSSEDKLAEAINLTEALNLEVVGSSSVTLKRINPKSYVGGGKIEEVAEFCHENGVDIVVVNTQLSPSQQRNLELMMELKVVDRTHLILEIFADRARTKAGRLQVELAHCMFQQSRLVRTWTHLERQRGGLGKTGGPGERQIELDRRMIQERIINIKKQLVSVEKERELHRKTRKKSRIPVVALVGYTNAGKSTLFNALVGDEAEAKDMLFATLDPLMRRFLLPNNEPIILSDTVGFVSDLPHQLVDAFAATLEEVAGADLLLIVHDASSPDADAQYQDVCEVLKNIKADKVPMLHVGNKMDMVEGGFNFHLPKGTLPTSAISGEGVEELVQKMTENLFGEEKTFVFDVHASEGKWMAWLHAHGDVLSSSLNEDIWHIEVTLNSATATILQEEAPHIYETRQNMKKPA
ncbi:MAG: GTPase HflX [Pseudomonadota bacterium]|nr:GTPase HflX [Pseudomonadota bacterium]